MYLLYEALFGKRALIKTDTGREFPVLFSQNSKPGELPYRMTWFLKTQEGLFPVKHIDVEMDDVQNIINTQKLPMHLIQRMKKHMEDIKSIQI